MPASKKYLPHHLPDGKGRTKVEWPPVPDVADYRLRAIDAWLSARHNVFKPMTVRTPLLAAVCALSEKNYPLPTRRALSEAFDCNIFSIDGAISTALGRGEITEEYRYSPGDVQVRESIRRRRYLLPSSEPYLVYSTAKRWEDPDPPGK
jgi:hypothetical protein